MQAPPVKLYLALNLVEIPQMLVYLFIYIIFSSYSLNNNYFLSLIIFLFVSVQYRYTYVIENSTLYLIK